MTTITISSVRDLDVRRLAQHANERRDAVMPTGECGDLDICARFCRLGLYFRNERADVTLYLG
jgi:hypothetical protein